MLYEIVKASLETTYMISDILPSLNSFEWLATVLDARHVQWQRRWKQVPSRMSHWNVQINFDPTHKRREILHQSLINRYKVIYNNAEWKKIKVVPLYGEYNNYCVLSIVLYSAKLIVNLTGQLKLCIRESRDLVGVNLETEIQKRSNCKPF